MITNDGYENKEKIKTVIVLETCFVLLGGLFFIYNIYVDKCLNKNLKYLTVHIYKGFFFCRYSNAFAYIFQIEVNYSHIILL